MPPSVAELVARTCWEKHPADTLLLAVLSSGLDVEGCVVHLALHSLAAATQSRRQFEEESAPSGLPVASPLFFILLNDGTDSSTIHRLVETFQLALDSIWTRQYATLLGTAPQIHAVEEGTSTKHRSDMFLQGGIIVMCGRFFCADVLHQRVSLHFSLVGAVLLVPCCCHRSSSSAAPMAPRRIAKHLSSLAFATELLCARNAKIMKVGQDATYASAWGWDIFEGDMFPRGDRKIPAHWCLKAPLFFVSDHASAILYCLRSRSILEGRAFMKAFHVGAMEVFPRFRLDLTKHLERPHALELEVEPMIAVAAAVDATLDRVLQGIVTEVLQELALLEGRLVTPSAPSEDHRQRKLRRVENSSMPLGANSWLDPRYPCGVCFAKLTCEDAVCWSRNGLEATLRDALSTHATSVAPYRLLFYSLEDVLYLLQQLPVLSAGMFLLVLESLVSVGEQSRGVGGSNTADSRRPLWTLSEKFSDVVQLATARVFSVNMPPSRPSPRVHNVDDSSDDDVLPQAGAEQVFVVPPHGAPGEYLTLIKTATLGWARSITRKAQLHRQRGSVAHVGVPSLLIVVEEDSSLRQIVLLLCMSQEAFVRTELERFLLSYQRLYGRSSSLPPVAVPHQDAHSLDDATDYHRRSDDEEEDNRIGEVAERFLSQRRPSAQQSQLNAGHVHNLLLSQPVQDSIFLTALDTEEHFLTALSQAPGSACPPSGGGFADIRCVGKVDGCVVLSITFGEGPDVVMVRIINSSCLTPQHLFHFWNAGCVDASRGPQKGWSSTSGGLVPPIARVLLCTPTLRTLRMMESFQDMVTSYSSVTENSPRRKLQSIKIQMLHATSPIANSDSSFVGVLGASQRDRELGEESKVFHQLLMERSMLTQVLFVDRDARLETEQELLSGLTRGQRHHMTLSTAMPLYLKLRRTPGQPSGEDPQTMQTTTSRPLVIFDEREFRCALPYHFYCRGFDVLPLTLLHGDYLLSSSFAWERKSIPDLIQSLNSGRIHTQLSFLSRSFDHPVLLIEFSGAAAFRLHLQDWQQHSHAETRTADILRRLMACLSANPRVRVLWSRSPHHSAALGLRIRQTFANASKDADPSDAGLTQKKENEGAADSLYAVRVLRTFPGVDYGNIGAVMNAAGSLAGLASLSEAALCKAMGTGKGSELHNFLHGKLMESVS